MDIYIIAWRDTLGFAQKCFQIKGKSCVFLQSGCLLFRRWSFFIRGSRSVRPKLPPHVVGPVWGLAPILTFDHRDAGPNMTVDGFLRN